MRKTTSLRPVTPVTSRTVTVVDGDWRRTITLDLTDTEAHQLATGLLGHNPGGLGKNFHIWDNDGENPAHASRRRLWRQLADEISWREDAEYETGLIDERLPGLRRALEILREGA